MGIFDFIQPNMMVQPLGVGPMSLAPPLAKAANNVTGASIPGVKPPPYLTGLDLLNSVNNMNATNADVALKQQQAALAGMNSQFLGAKMKALPQFMAALQAIYGGGGGGEAPNATPSSGTSAAPSGGSFTGGVPSDNTVSSATAPMVGGGNPEIATNNFAGMRVPGMSGGSPRSNPSGWRQFDTPESGIAAISHQLDRY